MRNCRLCKQNKPLSRYSFRNDSGKYRTECKDCLNIARTKQPGYHQWHKKSKKHLKKYMRNYDLKRYYGLTQKQFDEMLLSQSGACAICKTSEFTGVGKKPHVDHCHKTGKIRALLCSQCNVGLGSFKDNILLLSAAITYLNQHANQQTIMACVTTK